MYELQTASPPATGARTMHFIVLEIPNDEHTRRAFEAVCFDRKFVYRKMTRSGNNYPSAGHVFYEVNHTDARQMFWLGAAFQSYLSQGL